MIFMCLAIPARVLEVRGKVGVVDFGELRQEVRLDLIPETSVGDDILVHVGFGIQILDPEEAEETRKLLKEIMDVSG